MKGFDYILARLKEGTTWSGIFVFMTGIGFNVPDGELSKLIATAGTALAGIALVLRADKGK